MALAEVDNQVYETALHEELLHSLAPQAPLFFEFHIQVPEDNGVPEALQVLFQVEQVLQRLRE